MTAKRAPQFIVGVDIAADSFVASILVNGAFVSTSGIFPQSPKGFEAFRTWIRQFTTDRKQLVIAMEHTGVYGFQLCQFLYSYRYQIAVLDPASVARQRSHAKPKNDRIDSRAIADYCLRFADRIKLWEPSHPVLQRVNALLSYRELTVRNATRLKNWLKAHERGLAVDTIVAQARDQLALYKKQIKAMEQEIRTLLEADPVLAPSLRLMISVPGVALLLAANLLVITNGQVQDLNPRQIANYLGICPHEHTSGTSVYKRARSSRLGAPRSRKLLNLGSRSAITHVQYYREYASRLVRKGKPKMVILNNVQNRLLRVICAVLRDQRTYDAEYRSIHPKKS